MIISITDKIANFVKYYCNKGIIILKELIINIIKIIAVLLMLFTMAEPNVITFLLSIILYVWLDQKGSIEISYICMILTPLMFYFCFKSFYG